MVENTDKLNMAAEWETPSSTPDTPVETKPQPQKFVREIDLHDGSGKQRYEGDSYEELIDKLAQAQEHATRKIQELSRQPVRRHEPEKRSSDFQELEGRNLKPEDILPLQSNPHQLFRQMFQAETGLSPEEFRLRENERRRRDAEFDAQRTFVEKHSAEYTPTPDNAQKMMRFLQEQNLPVSKRNLDYAFDELRGELASKLPAVEQAVPRGRPAEEKPVPPEPLRQVSPPPSALRPSFGEPSRADLSGGIDAAEVARISQLPPGEMRARIEQIFRSSRAR
jgi:hypothetical protein